MKWIGAAREIAAIEALLLAGHPDVEGLCLALSDWSAELRILEEAEADRRRIVEPGGVGWMRRRLARCSGWRP